MSHNAFDVKYHNNNVYNCIGGGAIYWRDKEEITVKGLDIKYNTYFVKNGTSTARFWDTDWRGGTRNEIPGFGVSDSNYYISNVAKHIIASYGNYSPYDIMTLLTWQTTTKYGNKDQHSIQVAYKPEVFYYNASTVDTTITLGKAYKDVRGVAYSDSVVLKPYTSIILLEL
jgi:hypothetical protein